MKLLSLILQLPFSQGIVDSNDLIDPFGSQLDRLENDSDELDTDNNDAPTIVPAIHRSPSMVIFDDPTILSWKKKSPNQNIPFLSNSFRLIWTLFIPTTSSTHLLSR